MNVFCSTRLLVACAFWVSFGWNACSQSPQTPTALPSWPRPVPAAVARWQALRFGMFIHWGPVSLTGREISWSRGAPTPVEVYDNLYKEFNPAN
ncbi:MAG TPA: hypothetical protein VN765_11865, partial [Candidatus Acidoferrum sp.]|nr:hypothetical protein [Candidatus Acidoferrum sp.]